MSSGLSFFMVFLLTVGSEATAREDGDKCPLTQTVTTCKYRCCFSFYYNPPDQDFHRLNCSKMVVLQLKDSQGNSARATSAATDLVACKQVQAIIGALSIQEAALIPHISKTTKNIPIISLTSPALVPPLVPLQPPFFIQMANDVTLYMKCIAAIIGHFRWQKVTTIYENNNDYSTELATLTILSDSLREVDSGIEHHSTFPSLSDPKATIEKELKKLRSKSNRVFIVVQSSLEFATLLFENANQMDMMEKGYVWIVTDKIASLLDSVDSSITYNMQGVLGFKTSFVSSI
ncbi:glutamate receptor 2.5-like [Fagus crenata]